MSENEKRYCVCHTPETLSDDDRKSLEGHKAAVLNGAKWNPGDVITVRFLEGSRALQDRVEAVAKEWTRLANLVLDFRNDGPTAIRIAFQQGDGSWSHLGTMCRRIPEPQPTMNFGWLTDNSPTGEVRSVVLHEFGHALGLIHEHQNPEGGIRWNCDAVIRELSGPPNNWSLSTIHENIFRKYPPGSVTATDLDPRSIMMYPIPAAWTEEGYFSAGFNGELSNADKEAIQQAYQR